MSTADTTTTASRKAGYWVPSSLRHKWFDTHWNEAADHVIDFLAEDGISLNGKVVADIGCGDGLICSGVAAKTNPSQMIGLDIQPTDRDWLQHEIVTNLGDGAGIPSQVEFVQSEPTEIPLEDDSVDYIYSWSAFEHVSDPIPLLTDIGRVLNPYGVLMIQIWPLYESEHGSHMWPYFSDSLLQFKEDYEQVQESVREQLRNDSESVDYILDVHRSLNRITIDELQLSLLSAGFTVAKVEMMNHTVHLTPELNRYPLSLVTASGIKLLARLQRFRGGA